MKRREFLGAACVALLPFQVLAQAKMARVGLLTLGNPEPYWSFLEDGFRDAGYIDFTNSGSRRDISPSAPWQPRRKAEEWANRGAPCG